MARTSSWWEMPPPPLRDHEVRIARRGWIFYVRGVKVGEPFRRDNTPTFGDCSWQGILLALILTPIINGVAALIYGRVRTWKVGVLCHKDTKWAGIIRVVYKERLAPGQDPDQRIAELVAAVNHGTFDPRSTRGHGPS